MIRKEGLSQSLRIPLAGVVLEADIDVPESPQGIVLFAHGSGSSGRSPRNRYVAGALQRSGLATVRADLLTPTEEQLDARTAAVRFDIPLLATRLTAVCDWVAGYEATAGLAVGLFGASTGAAAALVAAAQRPAAVAAVVSRGGGAALPRRLLRGVAPPTPPIVRARRETVVGLNPPAEPLLRPAVALPRAARR